MPRTMEEINPTVGLRLKSILAEKGITQKELAAKLDYTEQHISQIIRGKRRLTYETAQQIVKEFPEYRVEWLLCSDNYKNQYAYVEIEASKKAENAFAIHEFLVHVASDIGYQIEYMPDDGPGNTIEEYDGAAPAYVIQKDGVPIFYLTNAKYNELRYGVFHYTVFLLRQIFGMEAGDIPDPYAISPLGRAEDG